MTIQFALLGILLSGVGIFLLARKWNVAKLPNLVGAILIAFVVAIPFLWVYPLFTSPWARVLCIAAQVLLTLIFILTLVFYRFWRDPERIPVETERIIVSSADGEVIYVNKIPYENTPLVSKNGQDYLLNELLGVDLDDQKKGVIVIGIEMSMMNVHVNRCPIEGDVKLIKHIQGNFYSLRKKEAPFLNTRCTTLISNKELSVAIVQIASRLVRRIDNYLYSGQNVSLGQRLGMIRFGSQVAMIFPNREDIKVEAAVGQSIQAGISIIARY